MNVGPIHVELKQKARSLRLKAAVFASFTEPAPSVRARLGEFTTRDWSRAKFWLDVSGLALYFLDRLVALDLQECIPESTLRQLHQDLVDNRERTAAHIQEARKVNTMLRGLNIEFAFLKGLTLPKESVRESALRNQADLDILIRDQDAPVVKTTLQELGYELDVVVGSTWEFKPAGWGCRLSAIFTESAPTGRSMCACRAVETSGLITTGSRERSGGEYPASRSRRYLAFHPRISLCNRASTFSSICAANSFALRGYSNTGDMFVRGRPTLHSGAKPRKLL